MQTTRHPGERGMALQAAVLAIFVFAGLSVAMLTLSISAKEDHEEAQHRVERRYLAEAGVAAALVDMRGGGTGDLGETTGVAGGPTTLLGNVTGDVGFDEPTTTLSGSTNSGSTNSGSTNTQTTTAPKTSTKKTLGSTLSLDGHIRMGPGGFRTAVTDLGNGLFSVMSTGTVAGSSRRVRAVVQRPSQGVFAHSMFAGNSSGDPTYTLELGGTGQQADRITGSIYTGGDFRLTGNAHVAGDIRAKGKVYGNHPTDKTFQGVSQPILDLKALDFPNKHDYHVRNLFNSAGRPSYLPKSDPAHIFRLNPSDRWSENVGTVKDDFYLEDRYESFSSKNSVVPSQASRISLTGSTGNPGPDSNKKVFYIDGNLWIHSKQTYSFTFHHDQADGLQVTFAVRGNIYFSDNLLLWHQNKDAVAFIALKDPAVADSGNIYFGDPRFGTLNQMDAYLYAENNFHDWNLNASGSEKITVNGIMSAGNHVLIQRDVGTKHTKLTLNYDDRVAKSKVALPGVPEQQTGNVTTGPVQVISMYEVDVE